MTARPDRLQLAFRPSGAWTMVLGLALAVAILIQPFAIETKAFGMTSACIVRAAHGLMHIHFYSLASPQGIPVDEWTTRITSPEGHFRRPAQRWVFRASRPDPHAVVVQPIFELPRCSFSTHFVDPFGTQLVSRGVSLRIPYASLGAIVVALIVARLCVQLWRVSR